MKKTTTIELDISQIVVLQNAITNFIDRIEMTNTKLDDAEKELMITVVNKLFEASKEVAVIY